MKQNIVLLSLVGLLTIFQINALSLIEVPVHVKQRVLTFRYCSYKLLQTLQKSYQEIRFASPSLVTTRDIIWGNFKRKFRFELQAAGVLIQRYWNPYQYCLSQELIQHAKKLCEININADVIWLCMSNNIARGADVNTQDELLFTPLMHAAAAGNDKIVELLLNHGAEADLQNFRGDTALILAAEKGFVGTMQLLIRNGEVANVNKKNMFGHTPLIMAAYNGHTEAVQCLLQAGADVNIQDTTGPALLYAIQNHCERKKKAQHEGQLFSGDVSLIKKLVAAGADIRIVLDYVAKHAESERAEIEAAIKEVNATMLSGDLAAPFNQ